ncbi:molybdate ABC transporter substrate-binding protein [Thermus thermamylovorans]|uniref:Molybdate ABC transporter substrate-binding protein n=1 Tax=Thermus thermamylovorans TaxID=2509362 RepID=A0A4Q9B500_9DEIN|nr:molybdate ABC transporter substrate-binding protein [Thermus thermamylovorans]TBH21058.1 molybdate ABC transporter substrate-binding protein [Thermus thermamylovorans]
MVRVCWSLVLALSLGTALAQSQVRVVAAADLQYALAELAQAFEARNPGVRVVLSFGSSGKFYTQLTQGLEADLFFSAEDIYPRLLEERGLTEPGTRALYAIGRMAIWLDRRLGLRPGPEALRDPRITRLAIANPVHAPYGRAGLTLLEHHGLLRRLPNPPLSGLPRPFPELAWEEIPWESLTRGVEAYWDLGPLRQGKPRFEFVYGENISQAAQMALTTTQAGILALPLVVHESLSRPGVYWVAPLESHLRLEQSFVILRGRARPEVVALHRFVQSAEGRGILRRYGFILPGE